VKSEKEDAGRDSTIPCPLPERNTVDIGIDHVEIETRICFQEVCHEEEDGEYTEGAS